MDAPNLPPTPDSTQSGWPETLNSLNRQTRKLEVLLLLSLGAIIILGVGLNILLAIQARNLQARYSEQSPAVKQYAKSYRETDEPLYRKFALAVQQYASTNRDFQTNIWDKYRPFMTNLLAAPKIQTPATPGQPAKGVKK